MRKFTLGIAVVLVLAACGDDEGGVFTTSDSEATSTTNAPATTTSDTTATTTTAAGSDLLQKKDPAEERKDPAGAQNLALSKAGRTDRADVAATPEPPAPPDDRGDDTQLDSLWSDCAAGDMAACDTLYRESPVGSEYERFGDTCGGTTAGGVWCSSDESGPTDPYLDVLWTECEMGLWAACDSLYLEAPVGSDYEAFGATCGGISDGSMWCVDEFAAADTYLDGLWADCGAGDWAACDTLYIEAPIGSDYEEFGASCGYLTDGARWCTDEFGEPSTYGDDAYLDGLWDACAAGDMTACDALFSESPVGTEYEDFGGTCGYQTDGTLWCIEAVLGEVFTYGDDAYFDALWDACAASDWPACDTLYSESPIGSEYEEFGGTCGYLTDGSEWCDGDDENYPLAYGDDAYLDGLWDACAASDWAACDALYAESAVGSDYEGFGGTCGYLTDGAEWCVDIMTP